MSSDPIYQPLPDSLKSIRLLRIEPGLPSDPINVSLIVIHNHQEAPSYDSLSYVWGDTL